MKSRKRAFTLVELMIVISIIGILVGMLTPMISNAQKNAVKTTSKALFTNMVTALERYKDEYGYFPSFLAQRDRTNLDDGSYSENFVKAVTGMDPDGKQLSQSDRREFNRKGRKFMEFSNTNLIQKNGTKWRIVDGFGNPNIYVCVDGDGDGFIKKGFPTATDGINSTELKEIVPNPQSGIRSRAIIFTLKKDSKKATADFSSDDIFTW